MANNVTSLISFFSDVSRIRLLKSATETTYSETLRPSYFPKIKIGLLFLKEKNDLFLLLHPVDQLPTTSAGFDLANSNFCWPGSWLSKFNVGAIKAKKKNTNLHISDKHIRPNRNEFAEKFPRFPSRSVQGLLCDVCLDYVSGSRSCKLLVSKM